MSNMIGGSNLYSSSLPLRTDINKNENSSAPISKEYTTNDSISIGKENASEPVISFKYNLSADTIKQADLTEKANSFSKVFFNLNTIDSIAKNGIFTISGEKY